MSIEIKMQNLKTVFKPLGLFYLLFVGSLIAAPDQVKETQENQVIEDNQKSLSSVFGIRTWTEARNLDSNLNSREIEEESIGLGVSGGMLINKIDLFLNLELGYQNSNFTHSNGAAELELDGWFWDLSMERNVFNYSSLSLKVHLGQSYLSGRDFVNHSTGARGLNEDAELDSLNYGAILRYLALEKKDSSQSLHKLFLQAGLEDKEWTMNRGWLVNSEEKMNANSPWSFGLDYHFTTQKVEGLNSSIEANLVDGGYTLGLSLSYSL